ncbi:MutT/nudix family protein [Listeria monocytogenes]|nr:MutT/nudix family protein [Listeria monocytogenes]GAT38950.1 MutT/nudix family protein [Listeria monocytogenes]GAT41213.1 MutT/nudix family protein [Listeria monocytogenes]
MRPPGSSKTSPSTPFFFSAKNFPSFTITAFTAGYIGFILQKPPYHLR